MSKQDKTVETANSIIDCPLTRHHTRRLEKFIGQARLSVFMYLYTLCK